MAEWVAVGVSVVALIVAGWSAGHSLRSADAADRSAHSSEDSAQSAREAVRLDKRRYHDEHRPTELRLEGHDRQFLDDRQPLSFMDTTTLVNPTNQSYDFELVLVFSSTRHQVRGRMRLPARSSMAIKLSEDPGVDAKQLELWVAGDCPCGRPDGHLGHWKVLLDVPPYYDLLDSVQ